MTREKVSKKFAVDCLIRMINLENMKELSE